MTTTKRVAPKGKLGKRTQNGSENVAMLLRPFLVISATSQQPLTAANTITNGQTLRILIIPEEGDEEIEEQLQVVIYNPIDAPVVVGKVPTLKTETIASFNVQIPENWIAGNYRLVLMKKASGEIVKSNFFTMKATTPLGKHLTERILSPHWQINYKVQISNPTDKPVGNFSAFVALPITIPPHQIVKRLTVSPETVRLSSDVEGNHWAHYEVTRIAPGQTLELRYSAVIQRKPFLMAPTLENVKQVANPYAKTFLKPYLASEAHIESTHPRIIELAKNIVTDHPIKFAKRAIQIVNQILRYEIQPEEYGAAYAVETGRGDCTEFAALFVALCRAKGIPARVVAGFGMGQRWERHAMAEILVGGRWLPVDVTGQQGTHPSLGLQTNIITLTRGNWMGGTLAKEISYRYQILEPRQKLAIGVDWKITLKKSRADPLSKENMKSSVRVLSSRSPALVETKVKIVRETLGEERLMQLKTKSTDKPVKMDQNIKISLRATRKKGLFILPTLPDVIKTVALKKKRLIIQNKTDRVQRGCLEIHERDNFGVIRLLSIRGLLLEPESERQVQLGLTSARKGLVTLQFLFINRIGRVLAKEERTISLF
ncbi:MAG: transglutaminase-like domain-containing protein [Candidatus Heimdallarchaeota archaeon]